MTFAGLVFFNPCFSVFGFCKDLSQAFCSHKTGSLTDLQAFLQPFMEALALNDHVVASAQHVLCGKEACNAKGTTDFLKKLQIIQVVSGRTGGGSFHVIKNMFL